MNMMINIHFVVTSCLLMTSANGRIGISWGRHSVQRLIPSLVVDLLLQNGVPDARIYSLDKDILEAFVGSGINLSVGLVELVNMTTTDQANAWVQENAPYFKSANIRRVDVGDYVFVLGYIFKNNSMIETGLKALSLVQTSLNEAGFGHIKAAMPTNWQVLKGSLSRPSDAEFKEELKEQMSRKLRILKDNDSPFIIDMFTLAYVHGKKLDPNFSYVENTSTHVVHDVNGAVYTNVFEFMYDCFAWALEKAGAGDLELVVGQIGWPTDGYPGSNSANAERFFKSFLPFVASNKGTPKRPGSPINVYVHALTDENSNPAFFPFSRHWGIYRSNGEPKYKIDLSGQGRDIFPARAKGIRRMPQRWCVLNENLTSSNDRDRVTTQFREAYNTSDCTSLAEGGSCSQLDFKQNVSYAFNMYFQSRFQDENACDFGGLGVVVLNDPSTAGCVFPVEVVRGQQNNMDLSSPAAPPPPPAHAKGLHHHKMTHGCAFSLLVISILVCLNF